MDVKTVSSIPHLVIIFFIFFQLTFSDKLRAYRVVGIFEENKKEMLRNSKRHVFFPAFAELYIMGLFRLILTGLFGISCI